MPGWAGAVAALALALVLAPLLPGLANRVKALAAGRRGPPVLQLYFDLARLWRKRPVASRVTTWLFPLGPAAALASAAAALLLVPAGGAPALLAFRGDLLVVLLLLAAGRFALVLAALDTGSAFEGLGAGRELQFAVLTEPALLLALAAAALPGGGWSLSAGLDPAVPAALAPGWPAVLLVAAALAVLALAENARLPVDDPATHLELTMIHEVMILDHGGPALALLEYAAALKLWLFGALVANLVLAAAGVRGEPAFLAAVAAFALAVGAVESGRARLRLLRVPSLLASAGALAAVALWLELR